MRKAPERALPLRVLLVARLRAPLLLLLDQKIPRALLRWMVRALPPSMTALALLRWTPLPLRTVRFLLLALPRTLPLTKGRLTLRC
jgi:hypothetical protein